MHPNNSAGVILAPWLFSLPILGWNRQNRLCDSHRQLGWPTQSLQSIHILNGPIDEDPWSWRLQSSQWRDKRTAASCQDQPCCGIGKKKKRSKPEDLKQKTHTNQTSVYIYIYITYVIISCGYISYIPIHLPYSTIFFAQLSKIHSCNAARNSSYSISPETLAPS